MKFLLKIRLALGFLTLNLKVKFCAKVFIYVFLHALHFVSFLGCASQRFTVLLVTPLPGVGLYIVGDSACVTGGYSVLGLGLWDWTACW